MSTKKKYIFKIASLTLLCFMFPQSPVRAASTLNRGNVALLRKCPGDRVRNVIKDDTKILNLVVPLLTPLITGGVDFALRSAGASLKAAAEEMQADLLHQGSYFFQVYRFSIPDPNLRGNVIEEIGWDQKSWCVVVASRATESTEQTIEQLVSDYSSYEIEFDPTTRQRTYVSGTEGGVSELTSVLSELGFSGKTTPGVVAVFDIEASEQETSFRLMPRFVAMDHSIREGKVDDRSRDISFEFTYAIPGQFPNAGAEVKTDPLVKIEGLKIGDPYVGDPREPLIVSHWIGRPENDGSNPTEAAVSDNALFEGQRARTFDLTIQIKEFRKRPIAEFLGEFLTGDTTRQQLVQPIVAAIDPQSIQQRRAQEEAAQTALLVSLSSLIDMAEVKRRAYDSLVENSGTEIQIATALDELRAAQRAANLKAREAGRTPPYPDAEFFRLTPEPPPSIQE